MSSPSEASADDLCETVWRRDAAVLWRRSGAAVVLKAPENTEIVTLEGSGTELWHELAQPSTLPHLAQRLGDRYGIPAARVAEELTPVLDDLARRRLVLRSA